MAPAPFAVHRLTTGRVVAVAVAAAVVVLVLDAWRRGALGDSGGSVCLLLSLLPLAYVLGVRPAVVEGPAGLEVRNPLRTTVVPWTSVTDVDVTDVLRVRAGDQYVRCFAVPRRRPPPTALRSATSSGLILPPKEPDRGWEPARGQSRAQALADRLRSMRDRHGRGYAGEPVDLEPPDPTTRWAPDSLGALVVTVALLAVAVVLL
jgi:hypothetical protein